MCGPRRSWRRRINRSSLTSGPLFDRIPKLIRRWSDTPLLAIRVWSRSIRNYDLKDLHSFSSFGRFLGSRGVCATYVSLDTSDARSYVFNVSRSAMRVIKLYDSANKYAPNAISHGLSRCSTGTGVIWIFAAGKTGLRQTKRGRRLIKAKAAGWYWRGNLCA